MPQTPHLAPANLLPSPKESVFLPAGPPHFGGFLHAVCPSLSAARSVFSGPETLEVEKSGCSSPSHKLFPSQQPGPSFSCITRTEALPAWFLFLICWTYSPSMAVSPPQGRHSCDPKRPKRARTERRARQKHKGPGSSAHVSRAQCESGCKVHRLLFVAHSIVAAVVQESDGSFHVCVIKTSLTASQDS